MVVARFGRRSAQVESLVNGRPVTLPEASGQQLGALLLADGLIDSATLSEALAEQGRTARRLGSILIDRSTIDARDLARTLSKQYSLDFIDLRHQFPAPHALCDDSVWCRLPPTMTRSRLPSAIHPTSP
jgi:hypothetical protein